MAKRIDISSAWDSFMEAALAGLVGAIGITESDKSFDSLTDIMVEESAQYAAAMMRMRGDGEPEFGLRDRFAAAALRGALQITGVNVIHDQELDPQHRDAMALMAFTVADKAMKARPQ